MQNFGLGFRTLVVKETKRYLGIWIQSLLTPVMTTGLYLIIFGVSLGRQITNMGGTEVPYLTFIVPGLIMMGIINNSAMSSWGSIFIGKINGYLNDMLMAPLSYLDLSVGYILSGALRGLMVGTITWTVSLFFGGPVPVHPLYTIAIAVCAAVFFASAGIFVAVWAKDFDQMGAFNTFILLPLVYLGGVFYSLRVLPEPWGTISKFNPILYLVDGLRYGFLNIADVNPALSLAIAAVMAAIGVVVMTLVFKSGWRLKT